MPGIDYEALRKRHAEVRPLSYLTEAELAVLNSATTQLADGPLHDLAFLARLEILDRVD